MSYVDGVNVCPFVSGIITLFKAPSYLVFAIKKHLSACMLAMNSTFVMIKCLDMLVRCLLTQVLSGNTRALCVCYE